MIPQLSRWSEWLEFFKRKRSPITVPEPIDGLRIAAIDPMCENFSPPSECSSEEETYMTNFSGLGPSGFTDTNDELHAFAGKVVAEAKETLQKKPIQCRLWGFRHNGYEMLSFDLFSDDKSQCMPITITACHEQNLEDINEPDVYDMVEAWHLASLIIHGLDAHIKTGRHCNEVNERLLARPLKGDETNGKINLWKDEQTK